ncbi:MAG: cytidylate kinase-like family protein [Lachnospiraceae bacterium]|nr:cytidylate kinase-like family protein [Lachnospiraceae bacterium]
MSKLINCPVITISREYGAGGRSVAKRLSELLGIPWYDKDFVKATVSISGFSEEDILREGEEMSSRQVFLDSILNSMVSYTSSGDAIFQAQKEEILTLAKEPCIIVGRCANIVLKQAGVPSFDVFLYADMEHRLQRAAELKENGDMELQRYIETRDELRAIYHKHYTKSELGDYHNYDLILNTGILGFEKCVDIILHAL